MTAETRPVRIAILLSTCNGVPYVGELLESIRNQSWPHWDLWIRDDGSNDGTLEILEDFASRMAESGKGGTGNRVHLLPDENIGIVQSFFRLLDAAGSDYAGYAFCDQDDVWLPEKLERAALSLKRDVGVPFLYHGRQWLTDQEGGKRVLSPVPVRVGFANALIQNQVVGCTMVINARLRQCVMHSLRDSDGTTSFPGIIMHDWWCYLLASGTGRIHYDPEPQILFRRHQESSTPAATGSLRALRGRLSGLGKRNWSLSHIMIQAECLSRHYSDFGNRSASKTDASEASGRGGSKPDFKAADSEEKPLLHDAACSLPERNHRLLDSLLVLRRAGLIKRAVYLFAGRHKRAGLADTVVFRLLVLLRRF